MDLTSIRPTDTRRRTWVLVLLLLPLIPAMIIRASVDPAIEARRQRLATMPADQRARLLDKAARFDSLTDKQKAAIRQLHAQIEQRPDRDQLLEIMQGYSQWLATLSPTQRAELLELDTEQRVARIAELKRRYEEERIGQLLSLKLTKEQSREVLQWFDSYLRRNEDRLLEQLSEPIRKRVAQVRDSRRRRGMLISLVMQHSGPESAPPLTERDISELAAVLPVEAREQLQHMLTVEEKQIAARQWIHAAMLSLFRPPKVSRDELERFFTQLPAETRERLERLPRNRMYDELARRYDMQRRGRDRWRRDHRGRFRPNGPPPPGASPGHGPPDDHDQPHRGPRHGGPAAHPRDPAT